MFNFIYLNQIKLNQTRLWGSVRRVLSKNCDQDTTGRVLVATFIQNLHPKAEATTTYLT